MIIYSLLNFISLKKNKLVSDESFFNEKRESSCYQQGCQRKSDTTKLEVEKGCSYGYCNPW